MPRAAISLDIRLETIAGMCGSCRTLADIGTDHGRLGAYMLQTGLCENVHFTDISASSLSKARELLATLGLTGHARFLVGDGALALEESPDVAVIAGMGGETIAGIIARGRTMLADARIVVQPNVAVEAVRAQMCESGYRIIDETVVRDGRRLYNIVAAEPGEMQLDEMQRIVGPVLMEKRTEGLFDYASFRLRVIRKALAGVENGGHDGAQLRDELRIWEEAAAWQRQD